MSVGGYSGGGWAWVTALSLVANVWQGLRASTAAAPAADESACQAECVSLAFSFRLHIVIEVLVVGICCVAVVTAGCRRRRRPTAPVVVTNVVQAPGTITGVFASPHVVEDLTEEQLNVYVPRRRR